MASRTHNPERRAWRGRSYKKGGTRVRTLRDALPEPMSPTTLHERIAEALGWSVKDAQSFSLAALREMVRKEHPKLAHEISQVIQSGSHIRG